MSETTPTPTADTTTTTKAAKAAPAPAPAETAPAGPVLVTVECLDPTDPNPTLHLEPEPTVFVGGKAQMKEVLANILVADRANVYKDGDFGKLLPKFRIVQ